MTASPVFRCCQPGLLFDAVDRDIDLFMDLARVFYQETTARFDDIARASTAGAFDDMGFEAHSLKGTVGAVGATELVGLLHDIEAAGLQHRHACSTAQLARLEVLLQHARDDVHAFVATLK